jgi:hypothetical protein
VPRPSPTFCSAGGERSRPLKQHAEQRVQVNGYHRIAGDQHSVATPVQAEVSRRVTGSMDDSPIGQLWYANLRIKPLYHRGQVGSGGDLRLSLLRKSAS